MIELHRTNANSVGISIENKLKNGSTIFSYSSAAIATDCHSNNHIYSNTIQNVNTGVKMIGYYGLPMSLSFYDTGNDVGGNNSSQGNTFINFGGTSVGYGVRAEEQLQLNVSNNSIDNYNSGSNSAVATTATIYGVYNAMSAISFLNQNSTTNNNSILVTTIAGFTNTAAGIYSYRCNGNRAVSNNTIKVANLSGSACNGTYYGVYDFTNLAGASVGQNWNMTNNTLNNITINDNAGTFYGFYVSGHGGYANTFSGNEMKNFQRNGGTTGQTYPLYSFNDANYKTLGSSANWFNNTFIGISNGNSTADMFFYWAPGGGIGGTTNIYNNTISNISSGGSFRNYMPYYNHKSTINVYSNTISQITTGSSAHSIIGLACYFQDSTNSNIYQNEINDISANDSATTVQGVLTSSTAGATNFYKNRIAYLYNTSNKFNASASIIGLTANVGLSSSGVNGLFNCYNNYIGYFTANANSNLGWGVEGIAFSALSYDTVKTKVANFYDNTIYVTGVSNQAYFGACGIYLSDVKDDTVLLQNNIIINLAKNLNAAPATYLWQTSATCIGKQYLNKPVLNSNHNILYAGTPSAYNLIYSNGNNSYQTLASYQAALNQDVASFTENTNFQSTTPGTTNFLHINPAYATKCESGGIAFNNVADDFDGDIRFGNTGYAGTGSAPDIGADEFNGSNTCSYSYHNIVDTICGSFVFHSKTLTVSGVYYDTLLNAGGCDSIVTLFLTIDSSYCVWPGDANNDRVANNLDIFPIGLLNGATGPVRTNASIIWVKQAANNWGTLIPNSITDAKHADCNGDGVIDGNDTTAILQNYGLTHLRIKASTNHLLSMSVGPDTLYQNTTATVLVGLGSSSVPVDSIYGVAFSFHVDPTCIDTNSVQISTPASWLFQNSTDHFQLFKLNKSGTIAHVGLVRNNHIAKSGFGDFVTITIDITTGNIIGREDVLFNKKYKLHCSIDNISILKLDGSIVQSAVVEDSASTIFYNRNVGVNNLNNVTASQTLIPNPATNKVLVRLKGYDYNERKQLIMMDAIGRIVVQGSFTTNQFDLNLQEFSAGIYIVKIISEKGVSESKLIKE